MIRYCLSKLESFMAPKQVVFMDALPKTDTGKIKKTGLATPASAIARGSKE